jgi:DNA-binding CsgD family transcriptional regulator
MSPSGHFLSDPATTLYEDLLVGAGVDAESAAADELLARGLAARIDGRLVAAPPAAAIPEALTTRMSAVAAEHEALSAAYREAGRLQQRFTEAQLRGHLSGHVSLLSGEATRAAAVSLIQNAQSELLHLNAGRYRGAPATTDIVHADTEAMAGPLTVRCVYAQHFLEIGETVRNIRYSQQLGEQIRVSDEVPFSLYLADGRIALVPLLVDGLHGAILLTDTPLVDSLRAVFELLWERGSPWGEDRTDETLTPIQRRILELLAAGFTDERVAATLGVTTRTVRRHVSTVMALLGANTRFAAAVAAQRRGWV